MENGYTKYLQYSLRKTQTYIADCAPACYGEALQLQYIQTVEKAQQKNKAERTQNGVLEAKAQIGSNSSYS